MDADALVLARLPRHSTRRHRAQFAPLAQSCGHGDAPPVDDSQKAAVFRLCASALSKCGRVATPQHMGLLMSEMSRLRSAAIAGETGCVPLLHDAIKTAHAMLDDVELAIEMMMRQAEEKAERYRLAFTEQSARQSA